MASQFNDNANKCNLQNSGFDENIGGQHYWSWSSVSYIPLTKGQQYGECFHVMTSSRSNGAHAKILICHHKLSGVQVLCKPFIYKSSFILVNNWIRHILPPFVCSNYVFVMATWHLLSSALYFKLCSPTKCRSQYDMIPPYGHQSRNMNLRCIQLTLLCHRHKLFHLARIAPISMLCVVLTGLIGAPYGCNFVVQLR